MLACKLYAGSCVKLKIRRRNLRRMIASVAERDVVSVEFAYIFTVCCSLAVLFAVFFYARRNQNVAGTKAFLWQIVFVAIWSLGSLLELISPTEQGMLFWRNFEQIGIFLLPVSCVYFSAEYTHYDWIKKYLPFTVIIPLVALVLIFTDFATHIMRIDIIISSSALFGKALSVHSTAVGMLFVTYNFVLAFFSLVILFIFSRRVAGNMRRQVTFVLLASGLIFIFALLKTVFFEGTSVNIPIAALYLPGSLILSYNLYRNNFFYVSPIAREKVFDVIEQGIIVTDTSGLIVDKNPFAAELLNAYFDVQEVLVGKKFAEVFREYPDWVKLAQNREIGELIVEKSHAGPHFFQLNVYPLQARRGTPVGSVTIMRDITAIRLQEMTLKMKAEMDSLTGLMNRECFMDAFTDLNAQPGRAEEKDSVIMIDIDKFKGINDTYGHESGDRVIVALADILRGTLRRDDKIGRIGGDEFAALLPGAGKSEAMEIAQRILKATEERTVQLAEGNEIGFTLSIGICDRTAVTNAEDMLACADKAMYQAKNTVRNFCVAWE